MHTAIEWFARNSVAANLLMAILVVSGILGMVTVHQQTFPNIDPEIIQVTVEYLGAAPEEVEEGVCLRIEEAVRGTEHIKKMRSTALEGKCVVTLEMEDGQDSIALLNKVKSQIDGISTFPAETEKPIVSKFEVRHGVLELVVFGNADERTLKELGRQIRDEISDLPEVTQVSLAYVRPYEISVEVSETDLRRYGLTLTHIKDQIRRASLDMPGGNIKTPGGEILLRAKGQAYVGREFEDIVVHTEADGSKVYLSDIATVVDGFQEGDLRARFNGKPAVVVKVERVGKEDTIHIAHKVKSYAEARRGRLPDGIDLEFWRDESVILVDRIDNLLNMAATGLGLVLVMLALFLRFRLAMWVAAGIPIAMLGTLGVFPFTDLHINMLTIMAFILVLGIVVDDAIVVGERIHAHEQQGKSQIRAAIDGTWEVSVPVIFGVLTTMAAFLPLIISSGRMRSVFGAIGWVVIISLIFSIIESQLILPAHLAHRKRFAKAGAEGPQKTTFWRSIQDRFSGGLERLAAVTYRRSLEVALSWRYVVVAVGIALLVLLGGMIASGRIVFSFFPPIDGEVVFATIEMPEGTTLQTTTRAVAQLEAAAEKLRSELDGEREEGEPSVVRAMMTSIGVHLDRGDPGEQLMRSGDSNLADVALELVPLKDRGYLPAIQVGDRWRELAGTIPDVVKLSFSAAQFTAGDALNFELSGRDPDRLRSAAAEVRAELGRFDGVLDVSDSFRAGKQEIKLSLLPEARHWGITLNDLAGQVRAAFYGTEAQRIQRGQDDVRVMVRFPEAERRSLGTLEDMIVRAPNGAEVPFSSVARVELGRGFSSINRVDGRRVVNVTGEVDRSVTGPEKIIDAMLTEAIPEILADYPDIDARLAGEQEERATALQSLGLAAILSMLIIYALLAIPLRSYLQPLVIMSVIPFGALGAMAGHFIMGVQPMFFSLLGIVAMSGVVVNASLVMVDYINRRRREGMALLKAVAEAGVVRFRPIVLTSVTTFIGLIPMLTSRDPSTAFIRPMAISLAYGVLFATVITLVMVPCLYLIFEDFFTWGELDREAELADQALGSE